MLHLESAVGGMRARQVLGDHRRPKRTARRKCGKGTAVVGVIEVHVPDVEITPKRAIDWFPAQPRPARRFLDRNGGP